VTISLTVLMEEEATRVDLCTGNICTLLLENDENLTIINPGGSPTALSHNINLLTNIEDKRINIVLTSFIPRYWSSLLEIYKRFSINMVVIPEDNIYISYKLSRYLDKISARKVIKVKNRWTIDNLTILRARSPTYSELIIIVDNRALISTPSLWMLLPYDHISHLIDIVSSYRLSTYVGGSPLLPDVVRDHDIFIRRFFTRFSRIFLGNIRTRSSVRVLDRYPLELKMLRAGSRFTVCD